jgi:hypothetical protein
MTEKWVRINEKLSGKLIEVKNFRFLGPIYLRGRNQNESKLGYDLILVDPEDFSLMTITINPKNLVRGVKNSRL